MKIITDFFKAEEIQSKQVDKNTDRDGEFRQSIHPEVEFIEQADIVEKPGYNGPGY